MNLTRRAGLQGAATIALASLMPRMTFAQGAEPAEITFVGSAGVARPDQGFMFLGIPAGFYEDLGIDADFMTIGGSAAAMQLVTSGEADLGHVSMLELLAAKAKNPGLPVKAVYLQDWGSGYEIIVPQDSPIETLQDLSGKSVGVLSLASGAVPFSQGMLRNAGVDPDAVELLPVGAGAQALAALRSDEVQALSLFRGSHAALENLGMAFRYFTVPLPSSVLAVNTSALESNRDAIVAALQGVVLNSVYMRQNPEQTVRYFWELIGQPAGDEEDLIREGAHIVRRMAELWRPEGADEPWGHMDDASWTSVIDFLGASDLADVDLSTVYTNELIPAVNAVDPSVALAKADADGGK